ncbi:MAG: hypothetical protein HFJ91_09195, partial [Muribaculaceae bacterium]|nr:hypothetical protein [Muribaculaceae bacterium]
MIQDYSISSGTLLKGGRQPYGILSCLRRDGMGYTYRAEAIRPNGSTIPVIIREQFMPMCSTRADDGVTVVTPEDVAPTVDTFLKAFIKASEERRKVSLMCPSIIRILDTFHANGTYYYVVEYLRVIVVGRLFVEKYPCNESYYWLSKPRDAYITS